MGVNITTIVYLRVLIIQIGSTIILMVVEAQGLVLSAASQKKKSLSSLMSRVMDHGTHFCRGIKQAANVW